MIAMESPLFLSLVQHSCDHLFDHHRNVFNPECQLCDHGDSSDDRILNHRRHIPHRYKNVRHFIIHDFIHLFVTHSHELMSFPGRYFICIDHVSRRLTMIVHFDRIRLCRCTLVVACLKIEDRAQVEIDLVILEMLLHERSRHLTVFPDSQ